MLVPSCEEIDDNQWGDKIGFNKHPKDLLPVSEDSCGKAKSFDNHSFATSDGSGLKDCASPKHADSYEDVDEGC